MRESIFINGKNVKIKTYIRGNVNSRKIIVTLHGGPGSGAKILMENESFKKLESDFIVVYFDQRGSGDSVCNIENKISIEEATEDVHSVVKYVKDRFKENDVYLWGGSFGGALGFYYLRYYPKEVKKYIAACPAIFFTENDVKYNFKRLLNSYKEKVPKTFMIMANTMPVSTEGIKKILNKGIVKEFVYSDRCNSKSLRHALAMREWIFSERVGEDFKKIQIPVMITHGKEDKLIDFNVIYNGFREFKNNKISFKAYEECGHNIFEDRRDCFSIDIKEFFK